jgi:2-oxoglutarate ferredoxin oxidoreductase subunit alpha
LAEVFITRKGQEIVDTNIRAMRLGCEEAAKIVAKEEKHSLVKRPDTDRLFISGDEAIALGALAAGCRFLAAYPICPATEIGQWLHKYIHEFNGMVIQTEDEIAAINMALGAAYSGVRAMTSTSGPGASLMMEGFSLSGIAEIPMVVVHVQRVGPSTGLPTRPEQSDLNQWVFGAHGDFPRIVLSPGTIEECFYFITEAFNLAEKYQCSVILLTEQNYGQNYFTVDKFDLSRVAIDRGLLLSQDALLKIEDYKRYALTENGISPRVVPSMVNGVHMVEGNEHDEKGYRDEEEEIRIQMMNKRMTKLDVASKDLIPGQLWGREDADIGIIGFGSTVCPIREAMDQLDDKGISTKYLQVRTLWPFLTAEVETFMKSCNIVFVVENNYSGQLSRLIQGQGVECSLVHKINKYSGHTFRPIEIAGSMLEVLER